MNAFEHIVHALAPFGYPCVPDLYHGPERIYFTYQCPGDARKLFGDDRPQEIVDEVQVHLFLPATENFYSLRDKVRRALLEEGFTAPVVTILLDEDQVTRHLIFECEIEESEEELWLM